MWSDTGRPASCGIVQVHVHRLWQLLGTHGDALRHTPADYRLDRPYPPRKVANRYRYST